MKKFADRFYREKPAPIDIEHTDTTDILDRLERAIQDWPRVMKPGEQVTVRADMLTAAYAEIAGARTHAVSALGYCPTCGAPGKTREKRPGGDDTCERGHVYPSANAVNTPRGHSSDMADADVVIQDGKVLKSRDEKIHVLVLPGAGDAVSRRDRADAARYRFLRSRDLDAIDKGGVFAGVVPDNKVINGLHLDAAVDAAMGEPAPQVDQDVRVLRAALRSMMCFVHGLCCPGCKAQGRELNAKCCKDADCDAGWYGVDAVTIKALLELGEELMPGTMSEIENPVAPVNEAAP